MVIQIRGTNGSGKSSVIRNLMTRNGGAMPIREGRRIVGYQVGDRLRIAGRYESACGEANGKQDELSCRVREWANVGDVVFDGIIASTIFERYRRIADEVDSFIFAFMDTPIDVCLANIQRRNGGTPIREDLVARHFRSIEAVRYKALCSGYTVAMLHYETATEEVQFLLERKIASVERGSSSVPPK